MYTIHATKKLLERVKRPIGQPELAPSTALGNWYATAIFWKPQVALFVNERTLLPVFVPLAPAAAVADRLPFVMCEVLAALDVDRAFVESELGRMAEHSFSRTANRSVVGMMTEFTFLAEHDYRREPDLDCVALAVRLSSTPCGPLYSRHVSPDAELRALVAGLA